MAAASCPTVGVTWLAEITDPVAEITESVAELLRDSVARVVGAVGTAAGCVWFAATTLAKPLGLAELATALMAWVAEGFTLLLEAEAETGDEVAAARTWK